MRFLGEDLEIKEAPEPTDIIWENREYSPAFRSSRTAFVWVIIFFMLLIAFFAIFKCSVIADTAENMYPVSNCPET